MMEICNVSSAWGIIVFGLFQFLSWRILVMIIVYESKTGFTKKYADMQLKRQL